MKKVKCKKLLALALSTLFSVSLLWGCGGSDTTDNTGDTNKTENAENSGNTSNEPVATVEQKIIYNLGADPKTIDPQLNSAVDGSTVIHNAFEGLTREDKDANIEPAIAESYDLSEDGTVYTFHLRDAKWSDGEPVKAGDFEYAWKRALDPNTAAEYAYQLFYLKNGETYNTGKATADDVGVKALDDKTLEVTLEAPVPYFLSLAAFPTYFPVRQDVIEANGDKWALSPETYVSNGPFKMSEWKAKESITFVKNENYWQADQVKLDTLEFRVIDDEATYLGAFSSGELDIIEAPPTTEIPTLLAEGTADIYPYLGTYFYVFNLSENHYNEEAYKFLSDPKVRKALALSIDRNLIVEKVAQGGQTPAQSYVPKGIVDTEGTEFFKEYLPATADIDEAKKLLSEAGYPDGNGAPTITFTFNTGSGHQMIAQAIQDMWKNNLGINIELKNEEWAVFQDTRNNFNYSIARHGWIADYNDPMTFLDMWVTDNGQNNAGYSNSKYDDLISKAKSELDGNKRTELLHQAEDILMEDMPILPIYYYTNVICANPKVKDFVKSPLGQMEFSRAYVE